MSELEKLLEELEEAEHNLSNTKAQLYDDEQRVKDVELLIFCEKSGLKVGHIVSYYGKDYAFHSLYKYCDDLEYCWILGNLIKKDGTLSKSTKLLYTEWVKA